MVEEEYLVASDGLEASELLGEVRHADGVVEDAVGAVVVGVGPAGDADDGEVLAKEKNFVRTKISPTHEIMKFREIFVISKIISHESTKFYLNLNKFELELMI
jgi:hypothetical protein